MDTVKPESQEHGNQNLDPREPPPEDLKALFKLWKNATWLHDNAVLADPQNWSCSEKLDHNLLTELFHRFSGGKIPNESGPSEPSQDHLRSARSFTSNIIPGLTVIPSLLPKGIQRTLLSRLLMRDLSNPVHKTNLSLHYDISHPSIGESFFHYEGSSVPFRAKDPRVHSDLSLQRAFNSKLRWITLGGQYDWSKKEYPAGPPPKFPEDIGDLLHGLFPEMKPQAAIVNFYSPGDTLSLHRDVSEEIDRGLASVSMGCDGIFIIGLPGHDHGASQFHILRLHSGDAVCMSGKARYAWHGVPRIISGSCPEYLADWPGSDLPHWRDYMRNKRINLNVRQMYSTRDDETTA